MNDNANCDRYQDVMDELFEGTASADAVQRLRSHAESCPDCEMMLRMDEHLKGTSLNELEAAVPDHLVEDMWSRVELDIMKDDWRRKGEQGRPRVWRWVVAVQAGCIPSLVSEAGRRRAAWVAVAGQWCLHHLRDPTCRRYPCANAGEGFA